MDFLRLPGALRRSILSHKPLQNFIRCLATSPPPTGAPQSAPLKEDHMIPSSTIEQPSLLTLSPTTLNSYTTAIPPTNPQLKHAHVFFAAQDPTFLYSAAYFRSFPPSQHPEVAFLGRSNVGKSSLLNALFGRTEQRAARVSKRPGRTTTMNGYGVRGNLALGAMPKEDQKDAVWKRLPRGGLVVVDMPGYGAASREKWGKEAMKYLENRKQLRCTFVLVDAEHGLKAADIEILTHLRRSGISHQVILSKVDKLLYKGSKPPSPERLSNGLIKLNDIRDGIRKRLNDEAGDGRSGVGDILCCSAEKAIENKHRRLGVDEVRWAIMAACGMEVDQSGEKRTMMNLQDLKILDDDD